MVEKVYKRTEIYTAERRSEPKQMFVDVADRLEWTDPLPDSLLDVGCAAGEFSEYILGRFPGIRVLGVDFDEELVTAARKHVPQAEFQVGDANDLNRIEEKSFSAITMTGTHSVFDDFRPSFNECIRACADGGRIVITGIFNEAPIDMLVYWRYAKRFDDSFSRGYNSFSKESVSSFLGGLARVKSHSFERFELPFDLEPQSDPVRSWTYRDDAGNRRLRNALMNLDFQILTIDLN